MFWGLVLEPGKRYTTTVEKSFHVSMAALDCTTVKQDQEIMSVMLETEGQESLLCSLCKQKAVLQEKLDLNFLTGDTVTFTCRGSGTVHLSGYLVMDDDELEGMMGEEEEDEEADEDSGVDSTISKKKEISQKRKNVSVSPQQTKKKKIEAEEESDEEEGESSEGEEDPIGEEEGESDEEGDSEEMSSDEEDDEEEDDEEEEDANVTSKLVSPQENKNKAKQGGQLQQNQKVKSQQNTPNKQQQTPGGKGNKTPMANGFTPQQQQQQSGKKDKKKGGGQDTPGQGNQNKTPNQQKTPGGQKTPGQQANVNTPKDKSPGGGNEGTPQKRTLEGGIVVKDLRPGNGPVAKGGKMISVYYTGKLKSNNKVFDSTTDGAGFKFRLGRGEVIKGWDIGIGGMKVGGKRIIICPPQMAYGQKGSPPHIPPNSSLVFEVELKAVN